MAVHQPRHDGARRASYADAVRQAVASLDPFEQAVVRLRYDADETLEDVARALATTPDRASAALMNAYRRVATALERAI